MTFAEFHNALRILLNIDKWELEEAGVPFSPAGKHSWESFRDNPWRAFINRDTETAKKIWEIVERRQGFKSATVSLGAIADA